MSKPVAIYRRRNGDFGSSYGRIKDTGHSIYYHDGCFTVWSIHEPETIICNDASRVDAQAAIARDWNAIP